MWDKKICTVTVSLTVTKKTRGYRQKNSHGNMRNFLHLNDYIIYSILMKTGEGIRGNSITDFSKPQQYVER